MTLRHVGNIQPAIDREEHTHIGGDEGVGARRITPAPSALKVTTVGDITYIAKAKEGSLQTEAVWQCKKIDSSSGVVITWANGNSNFTNVATDLTALTYS